MNKELIQYTEKALSIGALFIICQALFGAFSLQTRNAIRDRVRAKYGRLVSEVSGKQDEVLEAAHIDHNKSNPNYDKAFNGLLMTISEHYDDHVSRHNSNGLHPMDNIRAIESIWDRMPLVEQDKRIPPEVHARLLLSKKHYNRWLIERNTKASRHFEAKTGS